MNADERGYEAYYDSSQGSSLIGMVRTEWVGWIATVLAVIGVVLNNGRLWPCFLFWIASNALSAYIHARLGARSLMVRDLIFLALACVGLWQWTR